MNLTVGLLGWGVLIAFLASLAWVISTYNRLTTLRSEAVQAKAQALRVAPAPDEDSMAAARRELDDNARAYNSAIAAFPAIVVAAMFRLQPEPPLGADDRTDLKA